MLNISFFSPNDGLYASVKETLLEMCCVLDAYKTLGTFDYSVAVVSRDTAHLNQIIQSLKLKFGTQIKTIEVISVVD